ncbi:hypothetical protein FAZ79_00305 [Guyparkeria sp. SB14A]|uniref:hypothetical protein n=1 Tax=Guyparkeria sp. SB14A TaxID=2571147 RepID=UPI0010AB53BA|nr:hypothetical protein [Guyparkeria sp. SB14A]TKA91781.1 hypothetical protein FAZ79_00305 [Guyparkeria sp. SB14A]
MTNGHHVQVETIDGGDSREAVMVEVYSIKTGKRVGKAYGYPHDNNVVYWMAKRIEELNALCSAQQREIDAMEVEHDD